jgi:homocysteine S-methyltransferase
MEFVDMALHYFQGLYLITPFSYFDMTAELTRYVKEKATLRGS